MNTWTLLGIAAVVYLLTRKSAAPYDPSNLGPVLPQPSEPVNSLGPTLPQPTNPDDYQGFDPAKDLV
jgi:hypothetical protein